MKIVPFIPPSQRKVAMLAAQSETAPVMIHGSAGTGKNAMARWIHKHSALSLGPFISAEKDKKITDQLPLADGGTFLISEIGEWPRGDQKQLLQFLRTKSVPDTQNPNLTKLLNVRVIATSSQILENRAKGGLFNSELLQKLNVFRIEMPELAQRKDFEDVVKGILEEITHILHKEHLRELSEEAWKLVKKYEWPGNLREMRNVLRMAATLAQGERIEASNFPDFKHEQINFHASREDFEKIYLTELLKAHEGDLEKVAIASQMHSKALLARMQRFGIKPELFKKDPTKS